MYLLLILSLALIVNAICREIDRKNAHGEAVTGTCPECAQQTESGWLTCPRCRTLLRCTCGQCGEHHDRWDNFCPWCGQRAR